MVIDFAPATGGLIASGNGTAAMTFTFANAQAYPLDDASPLRTGTASFAVAGSGTAGDPWKPA